MQYNVISVISVISCRNMQDQHGSTWINSSINRIVSIVCAKKLSWNLSFFESDLWRSSQADFISTSIWTSFILRSMNFICVCYFLLAVFQSSQNKTSESVLTEVKPCSGCLSKRHFERKRSQKTPRVQYFLMHDDPFCLRGNFCLCLRHLLFMRLRQRQAGSFVQDL